MISHANTHHIHARILTHTRMCAFTHMQSYLFDYLYHTSGCKNQSLQGAAHRLLLWHKEGGSLQTSAQFLNLTMAEHEGMEFAFAAFKLMQTIDLIIIFCDVP